MKNVLLFIFGTLTMALASSTFLLSMSRDDLMAIVSEVSTTKQTNSREAKRKIKGQIFVVTRGGVSVPLGGVVISFYPYKAFAELLPTIYRSIAIDVSSLHAEYEYASKKESELGMETSQLALKKHTTNELNMALENWYRLTTKRESAYYALLNSVSAQRYYDALPSPQTTSQTDADGKFKIRISGENTLVAVACASRQTGEETEQYCWFVKTDGASDVLMNNNNVFGLLSDDSAIKMPALPEKCNAKDCDNYAKMVNNAYHPYFVKQLNNNSNNDGNSD